MSRHLSSQQPRRTPSVSRVALLCLITASLIASAHAVPVHLRLDQREDPLGIDDPRPMLSWQSDSTERDWHQSAYQILVASSADALQRGVADVWDSGKRASSDSVNIAYAGPALRSRQRCFWSVRVWDAHGHAELATGPALWEMGLLQPEDWSAQWIHRDDPAQARALNRVNWLWLAQQDPEQVAAGTQAEFRYTLHLEQRPERAVLHVLAGADFAAHVNGVETGHKELWGAFDREDIRDQLHFGNGSAGDNTISILVKVPTSESQTKPTSAALSAALSLVQHGRENWTVSDSTWQSRPVSRDPSGPWQPSQVIGPLQSRHFGVGTDRTSPAPIPDRIESGTSLFRESFTPRAKVVAARLYITALGSYRAFVNGRQVGQTALTPGFTDYRKRVLYQTYDVTKLLSPGRNTLGALLGAGWHGSPLVWSGTRVFPGPDRLRAQLELHLSDGSVQTVATGSAWHTAASPTLSSEIYGGEAYDARLADPAWITSHFEETRSWSPATTDPPVANLAVSAQPDPPVHSTQNITPISITMLRTSATHDAVFDMGQNMVGVARLHVRGPAGATVRLRFAERLNSDGSVYTENLRDADATDLYTLSGKGDEVWTPALHLPWLPLHPGLRLPRQTAPHGSRRRGPQQPSR